MGDTLIFVYNLQGLIHSMCNLIKVSQKFFKFGKTCQQLKETERKSGLYKPLNELSGYFRSLAMGHQEG